MTIHHFLDLAEISYLAQNSVQISDQVGQYWVMGCDKEETEPEQCLYHVSYQSCYIKPAPVSRRVVVDIILESEPESLLVYFSGRPDQIFKRNGIIVTISLSLRALFYL
jgi:hypothetical protein